MTGPFPGGAPRSSSSENTARLIAAVITALAVIGVLLVALVTSDSAGSAIGEGGGQQGGGVSGGPGVENGSSYGITSVAPTGSGLPSNSSDPGGSSAPSDFPSAGTSTGASSAPTPTAAQIRKNFPLPPGTRPISKYDFLTPDPGEMWFLTSTSVAATYNFYAQKFKEGGWTTYIAPSVTRNRAGKPVGYFSIYHLQDAVTTDLQLDSNYLDKSPGNVLIRVEVSDD